MKEKLRGGGKRAGEVRALRGGGSSGGRRDRRNEKGQLGERRKGPSVTWLRIREFYHSVQ